MNYEQFNVWLAQHIKAFREEGQYLSYSLQYLQCWVQEKEWKKFYKYLFN